MVTATGARTVADKGVATSGATEATAAHMAAAEARAAHMTTTEARATHMASATTKSTAEATATTAMASATTAAAAHIRQIRVGAGGQLLNGGEGIGSRCAGTHERCGTQYRQATQHLNSPFMRRQVAVDACDRAGGSDEHCRPTDFARSLLLY
ncbi:MAG: hypothetical protein BGN89_09670 [Alphaproteobacteria bacterium 64-6]|nr:MAG: hypothetical protein BGN89_09670 [Alphaproteobacteria bacterium 64-6]